MKQYRIVKPNSNRGPIFMGNGDKSGSDAYELTRKLHEALSLLSGNQQLAGRTDITEEIEMNLDTIRSHARAIYVGLTGEEISPFIREFDDDKNS